jgi:hypothetical protein
VRRFAGDEVRQVVVVTEDTAPRRVGRRERASESVPVTRVTVIDASDLAGDATAWLRGAVVTDAALRALTELVAAFRVAAGDPYVADADVRRALRVRVGYGTGEQVAAGQWTEAREIPVPELVTPRRRSRNRPSERLAALLAGRDAILACEELTLRARLDLTAGRDREAALQLEAALGAAVCELAGWVETGDLSARLEVLREHIPAVAAAASAAREGRLDGAGVEIVSTALERLETALRARALYAADGP